MNAQIKLKSMSTSLLNDLVAMNGAGIKYNPNAREEAVSKAKKDFDKFFLDAFDRIFVFERNVGAIARATELERNELGKNETEIRKSIRRRRSSV